MDLKITMPNEQVQRALEFAKLTEQGTTLEEIAQLALTEKLNKLYYTWRSNQRKPARIKRDGPGRPPLDARTKQCRELGRSLMKIYRKLKMENPDAYEALHQSVEIRLSDAVANDNFDLLEWFDKHRPWLTQEEIPEQPTLNVPKSVQKEN